MPLRAGICGVGSYYSGAFAGASMKNPDIELVAYAHLDQSNEELTRLRARTREAFGAQYGIRAYSQVAEMVKAESLDLVFVTCPDNRKPEQAVAAMDAGAHAYMSKPMCMSLAGADAMIAAAERNKVCFSALLPGRDDGAIRAMATRVQAGEIGKVITVRAWIQHGCFGPKTVFEGSGEFGPGQGGVNLSLGFYAADLLLWLIDSRPVRAYAEYDNLATPHSIWMDTGKGLVRFADGRMGSMDLIFNVSCGAPAWEMEVVGTDGIARAHLDVTECVIWHKEDPRSSRAFYRNQNDVIGDAVGRFVRSVRDGAPLDVTPEHARGVLELSLAWNRSAAEHCPVALPLEG
ncbi:MAG: Gfo/Idh/MocA family oxidoreductase [Armatimonadetes bacterium]|nr:Gfo/Idh/MocA family oxidoreductase [Armatimonadota bacterium]